MYNEIMKRILQGILIGVVITYIIGEMRQHYELKFVESKFKQFDSMAISLSKIAFIRGCQLNSKKKKSECIMDGFNDIKEIYAKVDAIKNTEKP